MKHLIIGALCILPLSDAIAGDETTIKTENDKISYSIGFQIGGDFKRQGVELSPDTLIKGIQDALQGKSTLMTEDSMHLTLTNLKKKIVAEEQKQKQLVTKEYREEGQLFLTKNANKQGVVSLPSGLQYKVLKKGKGKSPTKNDTVTVHYIGTLIDGNEFDSSKRTNKPATFSVGGVIAGWTEALQLMQEGDQWQLFIPPELAYGEHGPLANRTLLFDVELISVDTL